MLTAVVLVICMYTVCNTIADSEEYVFSSNDAVPAAPIYLLGVRFTHYACAYGSNPHTNYARFPLRLPPCLAYVNMVGIKAPAQHL